MKTVATNREISFKPLQVEVGASESRYMIQAVLRLLLAKRRRSLTAENLGRGGRYLVGLVTGENH
jgi:hypothetical protein